MKDFKIYIVLASLLLTGYMVAEYNKPAPTNWKSTLYYNDKIPYGTYIFHHQLNRLFPAAGIVKTNRSLSDFFQDSTTKPGNYIIVSHTLSISRPDVKALIKFISAGNHVFISAFDWDGPLADTLQLETRYSNLKSESFHFTNPALHPAVAYTFDHNLGGQYFSGFDTAHAVSLSRNQNKNTTYLRFSYGKGSLFAFANPHLLSNYSLLTPQGASYMGKVLSYLPPVGRIYWDEFQNHDIAEDESPMRVFFSYESLRRAYYISLVSLLVFVCFEIKRRQRIIPVIEPLKNATADFVSVIGRVYYEQRNNKNIASKKVSYLADFIRTKYQLRADFKDINFISTLTHKTGIPQALIDDLIMHIKYIDVQPKVTDHELITLNHLIEKFYAQA